MLEASHLQLSDLRERSGANTRVSAEPQEERTTMTVPQPRPRLRKPLDAGPFQPEIGSFRLHLAAEGKAAKTVRIYTEAVQWFAAAHLIPHTSRTRWEEVDRQHVQRWMVWLLGRYSDAYVSNQYRALQQFFKWWAEEEQLPDPMSVCACRRSPRNWSRCSPAENYRLWRRPARAARSPSAGTPRSSRCSKRPASGAQSWPGSVSPRRPAAQ